jgi:tight adherence protein B
MVFLLLGSVAVGAFCAALVLWLLGFGSESVEASARLARLREGQASLAGAAGKQVGTPLRRRASVTIGGLNLVSANMAANWATQLERAGLTLNVKEYFALRAVVGVLCAVGAVMALPIPQVALLAGPAGFWLVGFWLQMRISRRRKLLDTQLVELLQMMASALRAGFGLLQALEAAADQLPAPISHEVRRALRDTARGASVEQSLEALNERVGSSDFDIVVTAILIQRSVGGNLAEILDNVAHTMRERERIRGEINTLTSQQRMTGFILGGVPIGLGVLFFMINPEFEKLLFTDPLGRMMLGTAVVLEVVGFMVIRKIVNIEV